MSQDTISYWCWKTFPEPIECTKDTVATFANGSLSILFVPNTPGTQDVFVQITKYLSLDPLAGITLLPA